MAWNGHRPKHRCRELVPACERAWKVAVEPWLADNPAGGLPPDLQAECGRSSPCWRSGSSAVSKWSGTVCRRPYPPSRKTRALIAYLTLTPGRHSREQLCEMFWDVPDDPRGSLRWSLSKIRRIVDEISVPRLLADRQNVELRTEAADVDFL